MKCWNNAENKNAKILLNPSLHHCIITSFRLQSGARSSFENEKGVVLPVALMFMGVLALLGTTAIMTTTTDIKIGGNHKISEQAFYASRAGVEEARARLRANSASPVHDGNPGQTEWRAYIGSLVKVQEKGYDPGNSMHTRYNSLQAGLDYDAVIRHHTDASGNISYWGDTDGDGVNERNATTGENIYLVTGYGSAGGLNKVVEVEATRIPPIPVPAALYVEAATTVQGPDTRVIGIDACGGTDRPGIVTTKDQGSVTINDNPHITGAGGDEPAIIYNGTNMDVQSIVDSFKGSEHFSYIVDSATHFGTSEPGPGDSWGNPAPGATLQDPSSCSCSNIVHYDTGGTYVELSGSVSGCGLLLIEGDLHIDGNFSWYGIVIVTGSVLFTGDGDKNITGALIAGESAVLDLAGNVNIVYCSSAISYQTQNRPLRLLGWMEK